MEAQTWRLDDVEGVRLVRCGALETIAGIAHAFSTRAAHGRSDFDLGTAEGSDAAVVRRRTEFMRAAGFGNADPLILHQVHGDRLVSATVGSPASPSADGSFRILASGRVEPVPAVRTADCVALLIADRRGRAVAAIHAGWRGTAASIAAKAVGTLASCGIAPADLVVGLGPAILGCCYEVGADVAAAVEAACGPLGAHRGHGPGGGVTIDLQAANRAQLTAAGVPDAAIASAPWCTRCRNDLFFSVRVEGSTAGRLMAAIGPVAPP